MDVLSNCLSWVGGVVESGWTLNQASQPAPFIERGGLRTGGSASLPFLECSVWPTCKTKASHSSSLSQAAPGPGLRQGGQKCSYLLATFPTASVKRPVVVSVLWSKVHNIEKRLSLGLCGISSQGLERKGEVAWTSQMTSVKTVTRLSWLLATAYPLSWSPSLPLMILLLLLSELKLLPPSRMTRVWSLGHTWWDERIDLWPLQLPPTPRNK